MHRIKKIFKIASFKKRNVDRIFWLILKQQGRIERLAKTLS